MGRPTPAARGTPTGRRLTDGFRTKVTIGPNPTCSFWEIEVQPSGEEGGDPINTTTMHNIKRITKEPQSLSEGTDVNGVAAYDPEIYGELDAMINVNTTITVRYPNGATLARYGYLRSFKPQRHVRGEMPKADFVIVITDTDPTDGSEQDLTFTDSVGTP